MPPMPAIEEPKVEDVPSAEDEARKAAEAVALLKYIPRKAARMFDKTLKSAMANAENNLNLSADDLYIREAIVDEGPALKRFRPCARGSAHPYKKRMSHLRITLTDEV